MDLGLEGIELLGLRALRVFDVRLEHDLLVLVVCPCILVAVQVLLCALDGYIRILERQHVVVVLQLSEVLVGLLPRSLVLAHLAQLADHRLPQAGAKEGHERLDAGEVLKKCLCHLLKLLIRLVQRLALWARHRVQNLAEIFHE